MFTRTCLAVQSSSYATGLFPVPIGAARALAPDDDFRVAEILPGQAIFFVGTGEFRRADLGPYRELYLGFYAEDRESGVPATRASNFEQFQGNASKMFMWRNWVNTQTALDKMDEVGSTVFRLGDVELERDGHEAVFSMRHDTEGTARFTLPTRSDLSQSSFEMQRTHYGRLRGEPSRVRLDLSIEEMVTSPGAGRLELAGEVARACAPLELPDQPLVAIWIPEMHFTMSRPLGLRPLG